MPDDTPNRLESVWIQRNSENQYYEQINISGSDLIIYHDASGSITADKISVWAAKYNITSSGSETASYALNALSSSYALNASTASIALIAISASYSQITDIATQISASWASSSISASYALRAGSSDTSDFALLAGNAITATTASYAIHAANAEGADFALLAGHAITSTSASYALSSSFAVSASWAPFNGTGLATGSSYPITASWSLNSISSSYALTASFANSASTAISASWAPSTGTGTGLQTGSTYPVTSSWALNAISASWTPFSSSGADPTNLIGLTTINGTSSYYMRSDAAPAIDQGITPTWTGRHIWNSTTSNVVYSDGEDSIRLTTLAVATAGPIHYPSPQLTFQNSYWDGDSAVQSTGYILLTRNSEFVTESNKSCLRLGMYEGDGVIELYKSGQTIFHQGSSPASLGRYNFIDFTLDPTSSLKIMKLTNMRAGSLISGGSAIHIDFDGSETHGGAQFTWATLAAICDNPTSSFKGSSFAIYCYGGNTRNLAFKITGSSGYSGAGTKALFDDGTYKIVASLSSGSSYPVTASFSISASWAPPTGLGTGSTYPFTASWALNSLNSLASDFSTLSNLALLANTASLSISSSYSLSSSFSYSASWSSHSLRSEIVFVNTASNNITYSLVFVGSGSGYQQLYRDSNPDLTWNPSSNTLNVGGRITASLGMWGTASFARSASWGPGLETGSTYPITASWALNAQFALLAQTASYAEIINVEQLITTQSLYSTQSLYATQSASSSFAVTASYALTALTSSYAFISSMADSASNAVSASYALTASFANSSSNAISASWAPFTPTGLATGSTYPITSSWSVNSISSSYALTASFANSASTAISASWAPSTATGLATGSTYPITSSQSITASYVHGLPFMIVTSSILNITGTFAVIERSTGSFNSVWVDYVAISASNVRNGTVFGSWINGLIDYTEYGSPSIGNTNPLTMSLNLSASILKVSASISTSPWTLRMSAKFL
jgi:hypothetical protein